MDIVEKKLGANFTADGYIRGYADYIRELLAEMDVSSVSRVVQCFLQEHIR